MRRVCSVLFVLLSIQLVGQNWVLLNSDERYHFQHENDTIPLNTVLVDSVQGDSNMQVYYLNRLFLPCDTCTVEINEWGDTVNFYLDNQPTFLQREVHFYQASNTVVLSDPEEYTIKLPGSDETEWSFDKAETQLATNTDIHIENWFGVSDSVVTININNEPLIKIGKTLGLLKYFEYTLSGLEYARLGKCLPGFWEFYDFQIGDVFQFEIHYADPENQYNYYSKLEILSVESPQDSMIVNAKSFYRDVYYPYEGRAVGGSREIIFLNSANNLVNAYPNKLIEFDYDIDFGEYLYFEDYTLYTYSFISQLDGRCAKVFGSSRYNNDSKYFTKQDNGLYRNVMEYSGDVYVKYVENMGLTNYDFTGFETGFSKELIGYISGDDTVGTVYSDSFMLGVGKNEVVEEILAYPNPSHGELKLNIKNSDLTEVSIYSLQGQKVCSFQTQNNQTHDLSDLKPGVYIVFVQLGNQFKQLKWIKQ